MERMIRSELLLNLIGAGSGVDVDSGISGVMTLFDSGAQANNSRGMLKPDKILMRIRWGMDDVIYSAAGSRSAGGGFISNETWRGSAVGPSG